MKSLNLVNAMTYICFLLAGISFLVGVTSCCNFTMSNVMTDGTASDVIDDTDSIKSDPTITPNFNIPAI
jgi:hypothetical protein